MAAGVPAARLHNFIYGPSLTNGHLAPNLVAPSAKFHSLMTSPLLSFTPTASTHTTGAFHWRSSWAVIVVAVMALFVGLDSEQHRQLQIDFSGQIESAPTPDLSQLLPASHKGASQIILGKDGKNGEGDNKPFLQALLIDSIHLSGTAFYPNVYQSFALYQLLRATAHTPRAPPFA